MSERPAEPTTPWLIIGRKIGANPFQSIRIGDNITVMVGRMNSWNQVEIWISAPREIPIDRGERESIR